MRIANAWRKVEGVMGDRRISRKLTGNVLSSCVTPAYTNGLETMALTEKQQEKVQVFERQQHSFQGHQHLHWKYHNNLSRLNTQ